MMTFLIETCSITHRLPRAREIEKPAQTNILMLIDGMSCTLKVRDFDSGFEKQGISRVDASDIEVHATVHQEGT